MFFKNIIFPIFFKFAVNLQSENLSICVNAIGLESVSKSTLQAGLVGRQIDTVACVNTGSEA